jgi:hypothetical protein
MPLGWGRGVDPARQETVSLHREHTRSPDHALAKLVLQRRQCRVFGTSVDGSSSIATAALEMAMNAPSLGCRT